MAAFSVGSNTTDSVTWIRGLSFTPNVAGPSGTGSPGSATSVALNSLTLGCPSRAAADGAATCYIYSIELESPGDIGSATGLVGQSSCMTVGSAFGTSSFSSAYIFSNLSLNPSSQYFAYFSDDKEADVDSSCPYTGGSTYDEFMEYGGESPQFLVNMAT